MRAWSNRIRALVSSVLLVALGVGSIAHADRRVDGQDWPAVELSPAGTALFKSLKGKTLVDADALSVFLALLPPGYYVVDGPIGDDQGGGILQHDVLYGTPAVEYRMDLSIADGTEVVEHRDTLRYGIHTDPNFTEAGAGGHAKAQLTVADGPRGSSLTLRFAWLGQYHTKMRLMLNSKLSRVTSLEISGPVSERPGFRPPRDKTTSARTFKFKDERPAPFIETDCDRLMARLG